MEHADDAGGEVGGASLRVEQFAEPSRVQRSRHRIDAEVAPCEVGGDVRTAGHDDRQGCGVGV